MTSTAPDSPSRVARRPVSGRIGAVPGFACLGLVLALGVPPFLRMGLWPDATLYDVAARTVLGGGVHYRDVFDTNFPGMVWAHAAIRSLFGWRFETLRAADLLIVGAIVASLCRLVVQMGATSTSVAWLSVALGGLYLSASEFYHCQRDVWMLLPSLAAVLMRASAVRQRSSGLRFFRCFAEGLCWGAAIWIKPTAMVPAIACSAVAWRFDRPEITNAARRRWLETGSLVSGSLVAGALGLLWLWQARAWPPFVDVMLNWLPEYAAPGYGTRVRRHVLREMLNYGRPWTFVHFVAIPMAIGVLSRLRSKDRPGNEAQALAAACYLGWIIQAWFLQPRVHAYTVLPTTLLAWAMVAGTWSARGWPSAVLALATVVMLLFEPLAAPVRAGLWSRSFVESGPSLRDGLSRLPPTLIGSANWTDLARVASFLRSQRVGGRELLCFNEVPHVLYLDLDLKPPVRYMQFNLLVGGLASHQAEVRRELNEAPLRFVVSDLVSIGARPEASLPVPPEWRARYPWNLPVVFRAGRYLVHGPALPVTAFWRGND